MLIGVTGEAGGREEFTELNMVGKPGSNKIKLISFLADVGLCLPEGKLLASSRQSPCCRALAARELEKQILQGFTTAA